jgi:hypothetical protein
MKITEDVRKYAAEQGISDEAAFRKGMEENSREFAEKGNDIYAKVCNVIKLPAVKAAMSEPEIVTCKGKPVSVIIPVKNYEELLERVEDADDAAWLKRGRKTLLQYRLLEDYLAERNPK